MSGEKKLGKNTGREKKTRGKVSPGKNLVTFPRLFFSPIRYKSLHEHFLKGGHHGFDEDVSICWIDKTDPSDPRRRVCDSMRTLKLIAPVRLNTEERYLAVYNISGFSSVWLVYIIFKSM